ncbi:MAG: AGE family epimerase/isomerase [Stappiaceae bacterium]
MQSFDDPDFLHAHIQSILDFYENRVVDPAGGFFQTFRDDGTVYDPGDRHLVSSTRFIFNYATAYRLEGKTHYQDWARHGLEYLKTHHRQPEGHFAWQLRDGAVSDGRAMAYGHAFVVLAAASSVRAGISDAATLIGETWDFLEEQFWDSKAQAYADERDSSLKTLDAYRGQNANMHLCEAFLEAWEATGESRYLDRAETLVRKFAGQLADLNQCLIWEHYDRDWQPDFDYNRDKPDDRFKPWGFQPGHQVEWTKLLMQLHKHRPSPWLVERAAQLFDGAMTKGWDPEWGGLVYGFAPDGSFCNADKYFWVQAEAIAAAWRLYKVTGEQRYLEDYKRLWSWSWKYLVDHRYGAWYRILNPDGTKIDDLKSPTGKTDYHTLGACWDVLSQM